MGLFSSFLGSAAMQAIDRIQVHAGAGIDSNNRRFPFDKLSGWVSIPRFNHATRQTFCQERSLSYVGNVCAHHGWLWNRTLSVNPNYSRGGGAMESLATECMSCF
jgi:hypothetical protein